MQQLFVSVGLQRYWKMIVDSVLETQKNCVSNYIPSRVSMHAFQVRILGWPSNPTLFAYTLHMQTSKGQVPPIVHPTSTYTIASYYSLVYGVPWSG